MIAVDVCNLPATGGSTFVLIAGLFLLVAGVIVARWVRQSAGRLSVVVAPLVLLGGLVLAPQVADPCAPATTTVPSATTTVPSATTTVPLATTSVPSATTSVPSATTTTTSVVGAALTPTFGSTTATTDGFTVVITNYDSSYTWAGTATASGSVAISSTRLVTVAISGTGLITVTGVAAGTSSTATVTTTRTGYAGGSATFTATSLGAALTPTFGSPTATADGFTVQISNYNSNFTWAGTATASGSVAVSNTGLVTVTGVAAGTSSIATVTTTRTGYTGGSATVTATSLVGAALTPTFGTQTASPGGFQVQINNYNSAYTWAGTATASGSVAVSNTGLVTVMGVAYGTSSTATITTTRTGYTGGTAQVTRTCASGGSCAVGDPGPGGGIIFYVDMNRPVGSQYFEAAPIGAEVERSWATGSNQSAFVTGADGTGIGTGEQNTEDIVAQSGNAGATSAAVYCSELVFGGQSDWFLPSKDELNQMYTNLHNASTPLGGFSTDFYWSSSEYDDVSAWYQLFLGGGIQSSISKYLPIYVRPVRAF